MKSSLLMVFFSFAKIVDSPHWSQIYICHGNYIYKWLLHIIRVSGQIDAQFHFRFLGGSCLPSFSCFPLPEISGA